MDYGGHDHQAAAEPMGISRPTLTRIIARARGRVGAALVEGTLLTTRGGHFDFMRTRHRCRSCGEEENRRAARRLKIMLARRGLTLMLMR